LTRFYETERSHRASHESQAQTQLEQTRVQASDIIVQRQQYEHALAILLGKSPAELHIAPIPINIQAPVLPDIPVTLPSQLLERRPDISELERRAAANEQIDIAQSAYYPSLNLAAAFGVEGTSASNCCESSLWVFHPKQKVHPQRTRSEEPDGCLRAFSARLRNMILTF
jgi:outer membrane protein TolC